MRNTNYKLIENMIKVLQNLKGKTKLKFNRTNNNFYDAMNYRRQSRKINFEEDPFSNNEQFTAMIKHEALSIKEVLQSKPQIKEKHLISFDWYSIIDLHSSDEGEN